MPVTELAPVTFELEVEVVDRGRRWSLCVAGRHVPLARTHDRGYDRVYPTGEEDVLRAYDVAMGG
jgi:hypothetical protein